MKKPAKGTQMKRLAALGAFTVLVLTVAAAPESTDNSASVMISGCINVYPEATQVLPIENDTKSVHIVWRERRLASVTGYLIEYKSFSCDAEYKRKVVNNANIVECDITGLYSNMLYFLRMTVVCNSSYSHTFSPFINFTTPSQRVMVAPDNVSVVTHNATMVKVSWAKLDTCFWSGEPVGYVISVKDLMSRVEVHENITHLRHSVYLVPIRGRRYAVSVSAVNHVGAGPFSNPITFTLQAQATLVDTRTAIIISAVVVGIVIVIVMLLIVFTFVLVYKKIKKNDANVMLEPNPSYGVVVEASNENSEFVPGVTSDDGRYTVVENYAACQAAGEHAVTASWTEFEEYV